MKFIRVNNLGVYDGLPDLAEISARLDKLSSAESIDTVNWKDFNYKPEVKFVIAYSDSELFIKYYVSEDFVKAEKGYDNEMVCEDSCVEFFVAPAEDGKYLNFEFNSIGVCYMGSGTGRHDSKPVDRSMVSRVRRHSSLGTGTFPEKTGRQEWELTVAIPLDLLFGKEFTIAKGTRVKANFYKCGDMLTRPHYLTWNEVLTSEPDYHRPEYFGELLFD
ncbi:MAG: carbohydrate-binding family 9-like protein [Marinilabiliaceae bacterium]|nr:carbohydrate-binding family 9-like protein [Marinilabiliaceae bacterium]